MGMGMSGAAKIGVEGCENNLANELKIFDEYLDSLEKQKPYYRVFYNGSRNIKEEDIVYFSEPYYDIDEARKHAAYYIEIGVEYVKIKKIIELHEVVE